MQIAIFNLLIVVGVELLFLPLLMTAMIAITPIEMVFNLIIFPLLLCVFNIFMYLKGKVHSYVMLYLLIPVMSVIIHLMGYFNWGVSTGHFFKPDEETVMLVKLFIGISFVYSLILVGISNLILWRLKKIPQKNSE